MTPSVEPLGLNEQKTISVGIVEDNTVQREALAMLLGGEHSVRVAWAVGSAKEAWPMLEQEIPAVLLVDLGLPDIPGTVFIGEVKRKHPELELLANTINDSRSDVFEAIKSGASGYILKGSPPRELVEALQSVHDGGAPMSPRIARLVILELQNSSVPNDEALSARERQILLSLEKGLVYKEIAALHSISVHTVHTYIKRIHQKLHAKNRQEALLTARRRGLL